MELMPFNSHSYKGKQLPGASMLKADSEKGSAIVQEKITGQSIIRYTEFFFPKETKPVILSDKKDFQLLAAVKNSGSGLGF